jgi:FkbM family methyltransferase
LTSPASTPNSRIVARETAFRLFINAIERRRLLGRRARIQAKQPLRLAIVPDDEIGIEILQFGLYEARLLSMLFDDVLAPYCDDFKQLMALDVGANIGNHSVYLAQRFDQVLAFEPGKVASHLLRANMYLNAVENFRVFEVGLSDQDARAALLQREANNLGSSTISAESDDTATHTIELRRGDALLRELHLTKRIGLVKIDVEGHEAAVLRGLSETLRAHEPIILFETFGRDGESGSDAILSFLRRVGYKNFYTLAKDFPFPSLRAPVARAALRAVMGARFVLTRRDVFDDRYYNLAIATVNEELC